MSDNIPAISAADGWKNYADAADLSDMPPVLSNLLQQAFVAGWIGSMGAWAQIEDISSTDVEFGIRMSKMATEAEQWFYKLHEAFPKLMEESRNEVAAMLPNLMAQFLSQLRQPETKRTVH